MHDISTNILSISLLDIKSAAEVAEFYIFKNVTFATVFNALYRDDAVLMLAYGW